MLNPPFGFCTRPVHPWTVMVDTFLGHFSPPFLLFGGEHFAFALIVCIP